MMLSTNQFAHDLLSKTNPIDGTVILTDNQSAGKGQGGRSWNALPEKNITCSIIYDTSFLQARQSYFLNMAVANGLYDCLAHDLPEVNLRIKWPNDLMFAEKKLAGILIENAVKGNYLKHSIIGIGLNVNQTEFIGLPHATSMWNEQPKEGGYVLGQVLERLCIGVEQQFLKLRNGKHDSIGNLYNERLFKKGEIVEWVRAGEALHGMPLHVNDQGQLEAEIDGVSHTFRHGDIEWAF
jgi:BirA family biotin operon repressor/biotin-[acetyl-CoA-carboxylase] ligase